MKQKYYIVGTGGFGRETLCCVVDMLKGTSHDYRTAVRFVVDDQYATQEKVLGVDVLRITEFEPSDGEVVVAIGDPHARKRIVQRLPASTRYGKIIHPSAVISEWVKLGPGAIVTAGVILTCDIAVGAHAHFNLHSTVGHDCVIGDFFTAAPAMNMSGKCTVGDRVYCGTNSSIREGIRICDDVTVGMGGVVVKNIDQPGVYIGNPLKKLEKN